MELIDDYLFNLIVIVLVKDLYKPYCNEISIQFDEFYFGF